MKQVKLADPFWAPRMETNRRVTLPIEYEQCKKTGRIDAFRLDWKPGMPNPPHIFWDSDVYKWIEAGAYALATGRDAQLEKLFDDVIDLIAGAQQKDGYLNVHFTVVEPGKRWTNLRDCHELYCAGHLFEAAVAYAEATGKRKLLDVACRYADHIDSVFGTEPGKRRGYCGHEEIELALVKLSRITGTRRYMELAKYFIDERGRTPYYFDIEARERGEDPSKHWTAGPGPLRYEYCQAHKPVREQTEVVGHAVRAMYLYSAMADLAGEFADKALFSATKRLWEHLTTRRMYITGGIGPSRHNEGFTCDYDLPNETAYAETCAAIGLVFWAHRMLQLEPDSRYADIMERALYNGVTSGVSLDGRRFFYENPLASLGRHHRQDWFDCACCPPNIARLIASIGQYVYSLGEKAVYVHLYAQGEAFIEVDGTALRTVQKTMYPWDGKVVLELEPERPARFALALRLPGWCRKPKVSLNGKAFSLSGRVRCGYAVIEREWRAGDRVEVLLPMSVERVEAHPEVRPDCGRIALMRGPIVYCLEEADNGRLLHDVVIPREAKLSARMEKDLLGGVVVVTGKAYRRDMRGWDGVLYRAERSKTKPFTFKAVPYCVWDNRSPGEMLVWVRDS